LRSIPKARIKFIHAVNGQALGGVEGILQEHLHDGLAPWRRHPISRCNPLHAIACLHYAGTMLGLL
jgi:hypothetical protein